MTGQLCLQEAEELLRRIDADEAKLVARRIDLERRLEAAEQQAREEFFEGDQTGIVERLAKATAETETAARLLNSALATLATRRAEAERMRDHARVADLRQQATERRAEIERLNDRARALLKKLSDLLRVELGLEILCASRAPQGNFAFSGAVAPDLCSPTESVALNPEGAYQIPLTRTLLNQAIELDGRAHELEVQLTLGSVRPVARAAIGAGLRADLLSEEIAAQKPRLIQAGSEQDIFTTGAERIDALTKGKNK